MPNIRVASAQINTTVGDISGNCKLIADAIDEARSIGTDIVAFPELSITGYPPEDLLLSQHFVRTNRRALDEIADHCQNIAAMIGIVDYDEDDSGNIKNIYNAAAIIVDTPNRSHLPQEPATQLRRIRRTPILHTRQILPNHRHQRRPRRRKHLRRHLGNPRTRRRPMHRRSKTYPHLKLLPLRNRKTPDTHRPSNRPS